MRQIETVRSDVGEDERLLRDDEVDAVCGGHRAGGDKEKYMEIKLQEVFVTSV
jgi:hypothetical protein